MSAGAAFAGIQIAGALLDGVMSNTAARAEADGLDESGRQALLAGEQDITATRHEERQVSGNAIAAIAGSGTMVGTGTAADIIRQNAIEREVEIGNIRAQAQARNRDYRQAGRDRRYAGKQALIGAVFKAAGTAASYGMDMATQKKAAEQAARERNSRTSTGARNVTTRRFGVVSQPGRG